MTPAEAKELKRGDPVLVKGTVRGIDPSGKWIDVQFVDYALDLQSSVVRRDRAKSGTEETSV